MKQMDICVLDDAELAQVKVLVDSGFSEARARILVAMEVNGPISLRDISMATGIRPSTVNVVVNRLVEMGVATKTKGPSNRRAGGQMINVSLAIPLVEAASMIVSGRSKVELRSIDQAQRQCKAYMSAAGA